MDFLNLTICELKKTSVWEYAKYELASVRKEWNIAINLHFKLSRSSLLVLVAQMREISMFEMQKEVRANIMNFSGTVILKELPAVQKSVSCPLSTAGDSDKDLDPH